MASDDIVDEMTESQLGRELARNIQVLHALKDEKDVAMQDFKTREKALMKEINQLAQEIRTPQMRLYKHDGGER